MQTNGYLVKFVAILTLAACFSYGGKMYHEIAHVFNAAVVAMQSPLQSQQPTVAASTDNGQ